MAHPQPEQQQRGEQQQQQQRQPVMFDLFVCIYLRAKKACWIGGVRKQCRIPNNRDVQRLRWFVPNRTNRRIHDFRHAIARKKKPVKVITTTQNHQIDCKDYYFPEWILPRVQS